MTAEDIVLIITGATEGISLIASAILNVILLAKNKKGA